MGRRRKHDGDSGLASDQIPGQNQNNTSISLVTLYCTTTRPFAMVHECTVAHHRPKCKPEPKNEDAITRVNTRRDSRSAVERRAGRHASCRNAREIVLERAGRSHPIPAIDLARTA